MPPDLSICSGPAPPRLAFVEGLRALAALWVVLSHTWIIQFGMDAQTGWCGWAFNWLLYSHFAVDLFIVLSGFCLALPLARDGTLRDGAFAFWKRRARRILPPCYLSLLYAVAVTTLLQWLVTRTWQLDWGALAVNLLLLQDLVLRADVFNGPLWSIAVECRMYLVFPLLAWALRRGGPWALLPPAAAIGYALTALILCKAPTLLMSCPWYLLLFALGMCAASPAWAWPRTFPLWPIVLPAAAALAWLLWIFPITPRSGVAFGRHMPATDAAVGLLSAGLLVALRRRENEPRAARPTLLTWPPLIALGEISYSLYLTHQPTLRALGWLLSRCPRLAEASGLLQFAVLALVGLPVTLGVAYVFFLACERPFLNARPRPISAVGNRNFFGTLLTRVPIGSIIHPGSVPQSRIETQVKDTQGGRKQC